MSSGFQLIVTQEKVADDAVLLIGYTRERAEQCAQKLREQGAEVSLGPIAEPAEASDVQ